MFKITEGILKAENSTSYNVFEDLEDLKSSLGVKKLNLWGISWGTHVAFAYVKKYEASVNRMVLVSLEEPDETVKNPDYTDTFIETVNQIYQKQFPEKKSIPGLMDDVFSMLESSPVTAEVKGQDIGIGKFEIQVIDAGHDLFMTSDEIHKRMIQFF